MQHGGAVITRLSLGTAVLLLATVSAGCGWVAQSVEVLSVSPSEDGLTLEVEVDACGAEISIKVTEDDRSVGLFATARKGTDAGCSDKLTVELETPLGERILIDGYDFTELRAGP